ncbi:hypothetical protein [Natronosporangium hydrolyticum]|uniref:hypothetical protein n=1 Tax=Natronosporangium hydrolyticum TaxID=2811111 RepID=UPI001EFA1DD8|nr:hypothetical protein [Natronosporangium hydrolyticum]
MVTTSAYHRPDDAGGADSGDAGADQPPATAGCDESDHVLRGQLGEQRTVQVQPNGRFYRALTAGTHTVCLAGPADANFDLALQHWDGQRWQTVASSAGPDAEEQLTFDGDAGFYRVGVVASEGAGNYLVGLSFTSR